MSIIDPNSPGLFSFFAPKPGGPLSYQGMEARRRIALAMLSKARGYPKNIGEGLTAIGDAIGDRGVLNQLAQQESGYQRSLDEEFKSAIPSAATPPVAPQTSTTAPSAVSPQAAVAADQPPVRTAELTPDERGAGVVGSEANPLDTAAASAPVPVRGVTPNAQSWYNFAVKPLDQGGLSFSPAQAAAKVANLQAESSPSIRPTGVTGDAGTAHGAAQWRNDRYYGDRSRQGLLSFAQANGLDPNTTETQQKFMRYEYMGPEKAAYSRITAAQTPQDAATAINRYYERSADRSGNREAIAARLAGLFGGAGAAPPVQTAPAAPMTPPAAPLTAADAAGIDRLGDVTGMGAGDRGYSYPPTASLGRQGDVQSDVPPITGISPTIGAGAADTVQQRRDAIARARLLPTTPTPTSPPLPPAAPLSPSAAVVSDIMPAPPPPGAQLAQAVLPPPPPGAQLAQAVLPPSIKPPSAPAEPVPAAPSYGPIPKLPPKSPEQLNYETLRAKAELMGDPQRTQFYTDRANTLETARQQQYQNALEEWKTRPTMDKAAEEAQQRAYQERITRRLGGISPATYEKNLDKSQETVAGIPAASQSIRRARDLVENNKMFVGSRADIDTSLSKMMGAAGFPIDPRASGTEQFKTAMAGVLGQARKGIIGPGSQSDREMQTLQAATAADAKLEPATIKATLEAAERLNLQIALNHQKQVRLYASEDDPDRQRQVYGAYGIPTSTMTDLVPQVSVNKLFKFSEDPQVQRDFDNTYHTPGLAREVLRFRRPQ